MNTSKMKSSSSSDLEIQPNSDAEEILIDVDYQRYNTASGQRAEVILYTRDISEENNPRRQYVLRDVLPYFYVNCTEHTLQDLLDNHTTLKEWYVDHFEVERKQYHGGRQTTLLNLVGNQPWMVPSIRSIFEVNSIEYFEADIPFTHRFMIDNQLKGLEPLRIRNGQYESGDGNYDPIICSLDIEVDYGSEDNVSFGELISRTNRRITAIGLSYTSRSTLETETKSFLLSEDTDESEIRFLQDVFAYVWHSIDPDVIVTYNGDSFDWPYIVNRFKTLGIPTTKLSPSQSASPSAPAFGNGWRIPGVMCYDLYHRTRWLYTDDGRKTLNSVAQKLLGTEKISIELDHGQLWRNSLSSQKSLRNFREYVRRDAEITLDLWTAMNMQEWIEVIKICGAPPGDAINFTERQSGEFLVYQIMYQENTLIPPAPTSEERRQRKKHRKSAKGGLVLDPNRDLASSVLIADFASMYPSLMIAHNVGGESFLGMNKPPTKRFRKSPKTSMTLMQEEMLSKRSRVKQELAGFDGSEQEREQLESYSRALKLVSNSTFGSYNYIGSRFHDYEIASSITQIGRDYLKQVSSKAATFGDGYETVYGDTDSVFIEMPLQSQVEQLWNRPVESSFQFDDILPEIHHLLEYLTENLPEQLQLEFHDIAYRIIFHKGAKKRYAYVSAITKEIYIYGFESVRHDWSPLAKEVQRRAFDLILKSGDLQLAKARIIEFIQQQLDQDENSLKELLVTQGPLKRDPDDYSIQTPAIGAYLHHMQVTGEEDSEAWRDIDYFPFLIVKGDGPQKDRARHPDHVRLEEIDTIHYIEEALRTVNRFNLNITVDEVLGIKYLDLMEYFEEHDLVKDV